MASTEAHLSPPILPASPQLPPAAHFPSPSSFAPPLPSSSPPFLPPPASPYAEGFCLAWQHPHASLISRTWFALVNVAPPLLFLLFLLSRVRPALAQLRRARSAGMMGGQCAVMAGFYALLWAAAGTNLVRSLAQVRRGMAQVRRGMAQVRRNGAGEARNGAGEAWNGAGEAWNAVDVRGGLGRVVGVSSAGGGDKSREHGSELAGSVEAVMRRQVDGCDTAGRARHFTLNQRVLQVDGMRVLQVDGMRVLQVDGMRVLQVDGCDELKGARLGSTRRAWMRKKLGSACHCDERR
ncbi:unnamed protein product [Closterium sp. NIES-65]|nr:unnamed protein product [Closterium sp. NIES-65]